MHMIKKKYLNNHNNYYELHQLAYTIMGYREDKVKKAQAKGIPRRKFDLHMMVANLFNELVDCHKENDRLKKQLETLMASKCSV